jgi:hypothetical protein
VRVVTELDPNTPPVGRQQFIVTITPSKIFPWYGFIPGSQGNPRSDTAMPDIYRVGGARFTSQQTGEMHKRRIDPAEVETITVKRQATDREIYCGVGRLPPVFAWSALS